MTDNASQQAKAAPRSGGKLNWPLIRKFETFAFMSMLLAVPFFAFRVVDLTATQLQVNKTAVDLVRDLIRTKDTAKNYALTMTVCGRPPGKEDPNSAYLIQNGTRTIEEVILPKGVTVVGSITFDEQGMPNSRGTFVITKGWKTEQVNVNAEGIATAE